MPTIPLLDTAGKAPSNWDFHTWKEYQWLRFLYILALAFAVAYLLLHLAVNKWGDKLAAYEYMKLNSTQKQHISMIYLNASPPVNPLSGATGQVGTSQNRMTDSAGHAPTQEVISIVSRDSTNYRTERALQYIYNQSNNKVYRPQIDSIRKMLEGASIEEAISFLGNNRFLIKSYFWLVGPEIYFEIVFWCWFGVLSSLIYFCAFKYRSDTTVPQDSTTVFDPTEIPHHLGKLVYGPLCILAIILGYNYFQGEPMADIDSSKGVLAFAFLGGMYTARLIALLGRLKEVLLPPEPNTIPGKSARSYHSAPATALDANYIEAVTITLEIDDAVTDPVLRIEIAERGFAAATVTLQPQTGGPAVLTRAVGEDQTNCFRAVQVPPGIYTIDAKWVQEIDSAPITLVGTVTTTLSPSASAITIPMKPDIALG